MVNEKEQKGREVNLVRTQRDFVHPKQVLALIRLNVFLDLLSYQIWTKLANKNQQSQIFFDRRKVYPFLKLCKSKALNINYLIS